MSSDDHQPIGYEPPDLERPASSAPTERELEEEMPPGHPGGHDPYGALRFRDYRLYAIGGLIGTITGQMQSVAVGWQINERVAPTQGVRQAAFALGLVGLVQAIPVILLALPAGQAADRFDRKHVVMLADVMLVAAALGLVFLSYHQSALPYFYGCLFLAGVARALEGPARSALMTQLVPEESLANAVTWNSSRWQFASMIGPALGGVGIAVWKGATPIYVLDTLGLLVNFAFIALIHPRKQERSREPASLGTLLAGARFVFANKIILATITMDMFAVLLGGAMTLLPIYAREILHTNAAGLGWLRAAPAVGAFSMAMVLAHRPPMQRAGRALLWAVAGFGIATVVFGLSHIFWLSIAMLVLTGALDNISVVVRHTLVQILTPNEMLGRVSAINSVFIGTSNELGGFESGTVARLCGPVFSVVAGGIGTVLVVVAIALIWPQIAALGSLENARRAMKE